MEFFIINFEEIVLLLIGKSDKIPPIILIQSFQFQKLFEFDAINPSCGRLANDRLLVLTIIKTSIVTDHTASTDNQKFEFEFLFEFVFSLEIIGKSLRGLGLSR